MLSNEAEKTYLPNRDILEKLKDESIYKNNHSFNRARKHKLNRKKKKIISKYTNHKMFILELLKNDIKITDISIKSQINKHLDIYENTIKKINTCNSESELEKIEEEITLTIHSIENVLNKRNFMHYVQKGIFVNNENINLKDIPNIKDKYFNILRIYR